MVASASTAAVAAVLLVGLSVGLDHAPEPAPSGLVGVKHQRHPGPAAIERAESNLTMTTSEGSKEDAWTAILGVLGDVQVSETQLEPLGATGGSAHVEKPGSDRWSAGMSWTGRTTALRLDSRPLGPMVHVIAAHPAAVEAHVPVGASASIERHEVDLEQSNQDPSDKLANLHGTESFNDRTGAPCTQLARRRCVS